jgi:hypothetical protein
MFTVFLFFPLLSWGFEGLIRSEEDLSYDSFQRIHLNLVLFDEKHCSRESRQWDELNIKYFYHRQKYQMTSQFAQKFSKNLKNKNPGCTAVCITIGTAKEHITNPLPAYIYSNSNKDDFMQWHRLCQNVEIGIISHYDEDVIVHSVHPTTEQRLNSFTLQPNNLIWSTAPLCMKQEITTLVGDPLLTSLMCYSGILVVNGQSPDTVADSTRIFNLPLSRINETIQSSWRQSQLIHRTFTKYGFEKIRLPSDLWSSISTYYHNNRYSLSKDYRQFDNLHTMNWWNRSSSEELKRIEIPPILNKYWSQILCLYVEMWSQGVDYNQEKIIPKHNGQKIQYVSSTGFRVFTDASYQLPHVEDLEKIAFSVIMNIDQIELFKPWVAQLYDSSGRLHEITMLPGDILVYEVSPVLLLSSLSLLYSYLH